MAFSPLANMSRRIPDGGRSWQRDRPISGIGLHHNAGVDAYGEASRLGREVSANYWITNAGEIIPNIDESRRAFTSGHPSYPAGAAADMRNITIEISNSPAGVVSKSWAISDAARSALVRLIADIYQRYDLGTVKRGAAAGVGVHSDWVPTECPGDYIRDQLPSIIREANQLNQQGPALGDTDDMPMIMQDPAGYWLISSAGRTFIHKSGTSPQVKQARAALAAWNNAAKAGQTEFKLGKWNGRKLRELLASIGK